MILRADGGEAPLLEHHLARLEKSWRALMPSPPPELDWARVIRRTVAARIAVGEEGLARHRVGVALSHAESDTSV